MATSYGGPLSALPAAPLTDSGPVQTSGLVAASAVVSDQPCVFQGIIASAGTAAGTIILYDNASAASGTIIAKLKTAANGDAVSYTPPRGVVCRNGLYLSLAGTGVEGVVHFSK